MNNSKRLKVVPAASEDPCEAKPLGAYLVEAGILTPAQVEVVLHDQALFDMRFGEVLAARGWVKQQTVDYFMEKVVLPQRKAEILEEASATKPLQQKHVRTNKGAPRKTLSSSAQPISLEQQRAKKSVLAEQAFADRARSRMQESPPAKQSQPNRQVASSGGNVSHLQPIPSEPDYEDDGGYDETISWVR